MTMAENGKIQGLKLTQPKYDLGYVHSTRTGFDGSFWVTLELTGADSFGKSIGLKQRRPAPSDSDV
jgi:hypothetical protein